MPVAKWKIRKISIPTGYQAWSSYPDSTRETSERPYQAIRDTSEGIFIGFSTSPFYVVGGVMYTNATSRVEYVYNGMWLTYASNIPSGYPLGEAVGLAEANAPVYGDSGLSSVYFAKTTTTEQDDNPVETKARIRLGAAFAKRRIASGLQTWNTYPQSPYVADDYMGRPAKYQLLCTELGAVCLLITWLDFAIDRTDPAQYWIKSSAGPLGFRKFIYVPSTNSWNYIGAPTVQEISPGITTGDYAIIQANHNIKWDSKYGTEIAFSKTTTAEQDDGMVDGIIRLR